MKDLEQNFHRVMGREREREKRIYIDLLKKSKTPKTVKQ